MENTNIEKKVVEETVTEKKNEKKAKKNFNSSAPARNRKENQKAGIVKECSAVDSLIGKMEEPINDMSVFKERLSSKESFPYKFSFINGKGCLYAYEKGSNIMVRMSSLEIDGFSRRVSSLDKASVLAREYNVVVTKIDEEANMVFVSANKANEKQREELAKYLDEGIKNKEYVKVPAKVVSITGFDRDTHEHNDSVLIVNIGGLGITGMISIKEWRKCYTSSFSHVVKVGDVVDVAVIGMQHWQSGDVYECSRRMTIDYDPWKNIEEKVPKGTNVRVVCTDMTDHNFFGYISGLTEINAYCEYPDNKDIHIVPGGEYAGVVYRVDEKKKLLRVRITSVI